MLAGVSLAANTEAQAQTQATLTIDSNRPGPVIEPAVYAQFAEHLGKGIYDGVWVGPDSSIPNTQGYRTDVLEALRRLQVPVVRWPGGCFADDYDWRDGIGPRDQRPVRPNRFWGGTEDNAFGTHEFMDFVELIGSEAYLAGNMGSMEPRAMGQWVEYITSPSNSTLAQQRRANGREQPWRVKYFGVGNESWGCGGNMTAETSAAMHRRYQTFVTAPPENGKMIRVATGSQGDDVKFTEVLMRDAGEQMDAISLHYYTIRHTWEKKGSATDFDEAGWTASIAKARQMDDYLVQHKAAMDRHDPEKRVALYVDEWGNWFDPEPGAPALYQQNTLLDAVTAASTLNIFHRHTDRVKLTAIAQMVNVLQAMILTDGPRMVLTPTYHVFDLYRPFQGAVPYPVGIASPSFTAGEFTVPVIDATAARGKDGKLWLALVNADPRRSAEVAVGQGRSATGRVLTADRINAHNTFDNPNAVAPRPYSARAGRDGLTLEVPARSVAVPLQVAKPCDFFHTDQCN
jgi:alpha-N-arabinofuranosidase